jgi:predicted secreted Zn-dependent protease
MARLAILTIGLLGWMLCPAASANVVKSYAYFSIGGSTLDEIEKQLAVRGPQVQSTGHRHPGATRMEFNSRVKYAEKGGRCAIVSAKVTVKVKIILPRWNQRSRSDEDVRLVWDTLNADIRRHEESHVIIAKNHARELEDALEAIGRQKDCATARAKASRTTDRILAKHDAAQARFDKVEGINFESRIMRLLKYRIERIESGRLPG